MASGIRRVESALGSELLGLVALDARIKLVVFDFCQCLVATFVAAKGRYDSADDTALPSSGRQAARARNETDGAVGSASGVLAEQPGELLAVDHLDCDGVGLGGGAIARRTALGNWRLNSAFLLERALCQSSIHGTGAD